MTHCGTGTIETERLLLRKLRADDAEAMFRNWASDPEVTRFLTWPPHKSADFTRELLSEWVKNWFPLKKTFIKKITIKHITKKLMKKMKQFII